MAELKVYQSLWAMEGLADVDLESDLLGALHRILDAGFDGVGVNLARTRRAEATAVVCAERGRSWEAQAYVRNADELARSIDRAVALGGASHLNVQIASGPAEVSEAAALLRKLLTVADHAPLPVLFETHRGRLTNDLFLTVLLLEACPDARLTADLSHYVTAHEMLLPLAPGLEERIGKVLAHSGALHLRVAGPNQVQLPIDAPHNESWRVKFEAWWFTAVRLWLDDGAPGGVFPVLCELGPAPYAILGADGAELTDRWLEALQLLDLARALFDQASVDSSA